MLMLTPTDAVTIGTRSCHLACATVACCMSALAAKAAQTSSRRTESGAVPYRCGTNVMSAERLSRHKRAVPSPHRSAEPPPLQASFDAFDERLLNASLEEQLRIGRAIIDVCKMYSNQIHESVRRFIPRRFKCGHVAMLARLLLYPHRIASSYRIASAAFSIAFSHAIGHSPSLCFVSLTWCSSINIMADLVERLINRFGQAAAYTAAGNEPSHTQRLHETVLRNFERRRSMLEANEGVGLRRKTVSCSLAKVLHRHPSLHIAQTLQGPADDVGKVQHLASLLSNYICTWKLRTALP
ncbi:hypothetical protein JKP88DRAFT_243573 [Tribonema minus]|uniref:Uncharacterized protein n=1 Tax=Tribonema minus TaxID=303371 RepID=A0A836CMA0_9STRA|nr:hypothetical protein JKP88DRAFT_243573 [Tribonema minus]